MSEKNPLIRSACRKYRVYGYEAAKLMGISVSTYTRLMREDLSESDQKEIVKLIEDYASRRDSDNE